jgi:putative flippase GtrA
LELIELGSGQKAETSPPISKKTLHLRIEKHSTLSRAAKFAAGSAVGFLDTELILVVGSYLLYSKFRVPQSAFSSPPFWALNVISFVIGVSVAFFVNESMMIRSESPTQNSGQSSVLARLVKFQFAFLGSNIAMVGIQLLLLKEFAVSPIAGNLTGAIVSFPMSYFLAIHLIWRSNGVPSDEVQGIAWKPNHLGTISQSRLRNLVETISRQISIHRNYNMNIKEYRFDVIPSRKNETAIDFSLRMEVAPERSSRS